MPHDLFRYLRNNAAKKEDRYDTSGIVASACLPSMSVSSMYSGKYTVLSVMNKRLATYSIATLNKIVVLTQELRLL